MHTNPAAPLLLTALSAFHAALAAGAPWGRAAFGGQYKGRLRGCVALGAVGTVANAVSRSPVERLWSAWSLTLAVSSWRELRRATSDVGYNAHIAVRVAN